MKTIVLEYRVPYADTDQMGVVYYANYLVLFERARNELMRACGFTYKDFEEMGFALPVIHAEVDYSRPAKYDDLLQVECRCESHRGVRLKIACTVRRGAEILAVGHTVHCVVSTRTMRPVPPPPAFLKTLEEP